MKMQFRQRLTPPSEGSDFKSAAVENNNDNDFYRTQSLSRLLSWWMRDEEEEEEDLLVSKSQCHYKPEVKIDLPDNAVLSQGH